MLAANENYRRFARCGSSGAELLNPGIGLSVELEPRAQVRAARISSRIVRDVLGAYSRAIECEVAAASSTYESPGGRPATLHWPNPFVPQATTEPSLARATL